MKLARDKIAHRRVTSQGVVRGALYKSLDPMADTDPYEYSVSPDAYLARAHSLLLENSARSLFYAAFELRCFVESRQDQYLDAQRKYVRSVPKSWKIGAQGKALSVIIESEKVQHIAWYVGDALVYEAYHIPVSANLRNRGERLGQLLHAQGRWRAPEDEWWQKRRSDLLEAYEQAWLCNRGNLLSPMLLVKGQMVGTLIIDTDTEDGERILASLKPGARGTMKVDYPNALPEGWRSDLAPA